MEKQFFEHFMEWEEREHGKILVGIREEMHGVKSRLDKIDGKIDSINEDRWKVKGIIGMIGLCSGAFGALVMKHLFGVG